MKQQYINEIKAIVILSLGLIVFASLVSFTPYDLPWYTSSPNVPVTNLIRVVGAYVAGALFFLFGLSAYALVFFLFFWSWSEISHRDIRFSGAKFISFFVLFCVVSGLLGLSASSSLSVRFERGGTVGLLLSDFLLQYFGLIGAYIILLTLGLLASILTAEVLISPFIFKLGEKTKNGFLSFKERKAQPKEFLLTTAASKIKRPPLYLQKKWGEIFPHQASKQPEDESLGQGQQREDVEDDPKGAKAAAPSIKPTIRIMDKKERESPSSQDKNSKVVGEYHLPPLDLLDDSPQVSGKKLQEDLFAGASILEETLAQFGVSVRVVDIERGPVITRYELQPAPGVKVQRITTLSDDIALTMKAQTVRIVAPIPGKNRVGIEVPNVASSKVFLKDVLAQSKLKRSDSKLMLALGKDITGDPIIADLGDMPHLLIAGTTGSGKTVCVNSIIMSMLFNASPNEVKFLMVDPKMVELTGYNPLPHILCPTVTDYKKVSAALNWVVGEMESRYSQLAKAGVRNIKAYHAKGNDMPYIVVIIDELADLMQVAAKTIESAITRLAQLSRAVGIHLILATQRPSVDVITGVIKANFPARISFKVASKVDSRTVLDMNGAENLLGKGDLLFMKPGDAKPTRGQCSFVTDEEIHRVIDFITKQQNPTYDENIVKYQTSAATGASEEKDDLYDEAVKLVLETNQASVSVLQRRMRLGYTRAARLIDMMEQTGIVGPYCGSKPRDILVDREEWMMRNIKMDNEK